jgi:hypothetical protein
MGKKDFDNLRKLMRVDNTLNAGSIVSVEIDFEIPRGYIVKIFSIKLSINNWSEDFETLITNQFNMQIQSALLRDPDDSTTVQTPANETEHDVVAELKSDLWLDGGTGGQVVSNQQKTYDFPEFVDVITARNMRFNTIGQGGDVASLTESVARCEIEYTLEKVTDADILELLDIL